VSNHVCQLLGEVRVLPQQFAFKRVTLLTGHRSVDYPPRFARGTTS
jgi:hypothetical protein